MTGCDASAPPPQVDAEEEEQEEESLHFSPRDLLTIREAIVLLVRNLLRLLQTFPLKDKPQSADSCVQVL